MHYIPNYSSLLNRSLSRLKFLSLSPVAKIVTKIDASKVRGVDGDEA